jgi:MFS superfamily sulfate permease-like transporter
MRGFELVAIVIGIFFTIGIAVGVLLVIALPLLRAVRRERRNRRLNGGNWRKEPPGNNGDRQPPRWPGV